MNKKALVLLAAFCTSLAIYAQDLMVAEQIDANNISIDQEKNIIVKGLFNGTFDFDFSTNKAELTSSNAGLDSDHFLASYDSLLNFKWAFNFFGAIIGGNRSMLTDSPGNIYISDFAFDQVDFDPSPGTAFLDNTADGYGPFIAKYDSQGNFIWVKPYECKLIELIGKHFYGFYGSKMIKFDLHGQIIWERQFDSCTEPVLHGDKFYTLRNSGEYTPGELTVITIDTAGNEAIYKELARSENSQFVFNSHNPLFFVNNKMVIGGKYWGDVDMDPGLDSLLIHNTEEHPIYHQGEYQLDVPTYKSFVAVYQMDASLLTVKEYEGNNPDPFIFKNDHKGNVFSIGIFHDSIDLGLVNNEEVYISADAHASYLAEYDSSFRFISAVTLSESERSFNLNHPLFKHLHFDKWQTIIVGKYENLTLKHGYNFTSDKPGVQIAIYQNFELPFLGDTKHDETGISLLIYPVPAKDQIIIELQEMENDCSLKMYNINGQLVLNTFIRDEQHLISLNDFSPGVYFVQVKTPSKTLVKRIIKH